MKKFTTHLVLVLVALGAVSTASAQFAPTDEWTKADDTTAKLNWGTLRSIVLVNGSDTTWLTPQGIDWTTLLNVPAGFADGVDNTGAPGSGSEDSLYVNDGATQYSIINQLLKLKEGSGIDFVRHDSSTYNVILIGINYTTLAAYIDSVTGIAIPLADSATGAARAGVADSAGIAGAVDWGDITNIAVASSNITDQTIVKADIDTTASNFVFDDAYRGTSDVLDSAYATERYVQLRIEDSLDYYYTKLGVDSILDTLTTGGVGWALADSIGQIELLIEDSLDEYYTKTGADSVIDDSLDGYSLSTHGHNLSDSLAKVAGDLFTGDVVMTGGHEFYHNDSTVTDSAYVTKGYVDASDATGGASDTALTLSLAGSDTIAVKWSANGDTLIVQDTTGNRLLFYHDGTDWVIGGGDGRTTVDSLTSLGPIYLVVGSDTAVVTNAFIDSTRADQFGGGGTGNPISIDTGGAVVAVDSTVWDTAGALDIEVVTAAGFDTVKLDIADGGVLTAHLAASAVDSTKLAENSVLAPEIAAGAVGTSELAASAVDSTKIAENSVLAPEIATGAVGTEEIAASAVDSTKIAENSVLAPEIADGAVGTSEIAASAVDSTKIGENAVLAPEIAAGVVGTSEIANNSVDTSDLAHAPLGELIYDTVAARGFLTTETGDISGVTAGNGLEGGGESGGVTLGVRPGYGIDTTGDLVVVDTTNDVYSQAFLDTALANRLFASDANVDTAAWNAAVDTVAAWDNGAYPYNKIKIPVLDGLIETVSDSLTQLQFDNSFTILDFSATGELQVALNVDNSTLAAGTTDSSLRVKAGGITSGHIADNTIDSNDVKDGAIRSSEILDGTIADADFKAGAKIDSATTALRVRTSAGATTTTAGAIVHNSTNNKLVYGSGGGGEASPTNVASENYVQSYVVPKTGGAFTGKVTGAMYLSDSTVADSQYATIERVEDSATAVRADIRDTVGAMGLGGGNPIRVDTGGAVVTLDSVVFDTTGPIDLEVVTATGDDTVRLDIVANGIGSTELADTFTVTGTRHSWIKIGSDSASDWATQTELDNNVTNSAIFSGDLVTTGAIQEWNVEHNLDIKAAHAKMGLQLNVPNDSTDDDADGVPDSWNTPGGSPDSVYRYSTLHPSVKYIPEGKWGYKYHGVFTGGIPYATPGASEAPLYRVSNDKVTWTRFPGVQDPVFDSSYMDDSCSYVFDGHFSDNTLFWDADGYLWMVFRVTATGGVNSLWVTKFDSTRWTVPTKIIDGDDFNGIGADALLASPTVILDVEDTTETYKMWFVELTSSGTNSAENGVWMATAPKPDSGWPSGSIGRTECQITTWFPYDTSANDIWHIEAIPYGPDCIVGIGLMAGNNMSGSMSTAAGWLYLSKSLDGGTTWTTAPNKLKTKGARYGTSRGTYDFDYRATGTWGREGDQTVLNMWYSYHITSPADMYRTAYTVVYFDDSSFVRIKDNDSSGTSSVGRNFVLQAGTGIDIDVHKLVGSPDTASTACIDTVIISATGSAWEYWPFTNVLGRSDTPTDSVKLRLEHYAGGIVLAADSTNEGSDVDSFWIAGTIPFAADSCDSILFAYKVAASAVIDSIIVWGPDRSNGTNVADSIWGAFNVDLTSTSWAKTGVAIQEASCLAGDNFAVKFRTTLGTDNGVVRVSWLQMKVKK